MGIQEKCCGNGWCQQFFIALAGAFHIPQHNCPREGTHTAPRDVFSVYAWKWSILSWSCMTGMGDLPK